MIKYKVVAIPRDMMVMKKLFGDKLDPGQTIAEYVESEIGSYASQGWEFYRMDAVNVTEKPGCLGALFGQKETTTAYNMMTFRRTETY
jgi:hypothetical protein